MSLKTWKEMAEEENKPSEVQVLINRSNQLMQIPLEFAPESQMGIVTAIDALRMAVIALTVAVEGK